MKKLLTLNNLFLLIVFCMPLYIVKVNVFGAPSNILELLALSAIILTFIQKKKLLLEKFERLPKLLLLSCALIILGVIFSIFPSNQLAGLGILKGWFIIPMLFSFAFFSTLNSENGLENIIKGVYFSTVAVALIAVGYKLLGIMTYDNRLSAFYLSPNHLAMYLAPGIFFGLYFLLKEYFKNKFSIKTLLYSLSLLTIILPLYFTYSYGAWLAVGISLMIISLILIRNKKILFAFSFFILVCIFTLFILQVGSQKFDTLLSSRSSLSSRTTIWQVAFHLIDESPIIGIGPGNFQASYLALQKNYPPYLEWAVPQPHNVFLAFWLQTGFTGFVGFLVLLFFVFKTLWLIIKDKKNTALAAPLLGFFLYTVLHGLIDTTYWKNDLSFLFWICTFVTIFLNKHFSEK